MHHTTGVLYQKEAFTLTPTPMMCLFKISLAFEIFHNSYSLRNASLTSNPNATGSGRDRSRARAASLDLGLCEGAPLGFAYMGPTITKHRSQALETNARPIITDFQSVFVDSAPLHSIFPFQPYRLSCWVQFVNRNKISPWLTQHCSASQPKRRRQVRTNKSAPKPLGIWRRASGGRRSTALAVAACLLLLSAMCWMAFSCTALLRKSL